MRRAAPGIALWLALGCGSSTGPSPTGAVATTTTTTAPAPDPIARYRVSFQASWSAATHPERFPADPHFSPLVGAVHDERVRFWSAGEIASDGIEQMAERGATSPLDDIIRAAVDRGEAGALLLGGGIARSPGEVGLELEVSPEHPRVTLVSMIAPSPDWFVGISAENFLASGDWPDEIVFELHAYDAGSDSGAIYTSRDRDTQPKEPIRRIEDAPFRGTPPLGTFTFTRIR